MDIGVYRHSIPKASLAALDQGLFALTGLGMNVSLARTLSASDYGAFSVVFAIFLFLSGFHNALVLEPMSVFGPRMGSVDFPTYFINVTLLHFYVTAALSVAFVAVSAWGSGPKLGRHDCAMAISLPVILLFWTVRRAYYIEVGPKWSLRSTLAYSLTLSAVMTLLIYFEKASAEAGFMAMGMAAIPGIFLGWRRLAPVTSLNFRMHRLRSTLPIWHQHWEYGKWMMVTALLTVGVTYIQTFVAAGMLGLEEAGGLRALTNLTMPVSQLVIAVGLVALPKLSREASHGLTRDFHNSGLAIVALLVGMALGFEILLLVFSGDIIGTVYGDAYSSLAWLMPIIGLVPLFSAATSGLSLMLRAALRPEHYLIQSAVVAPIGILATPLLASTAGLLGVVISMIIVGAAGFAVTLVLYKKWVAAHIA